ncbi:hypothetical protein FVB43_15065 [Erwinia rhapontici]|nr:hypothetical protein [Erwinia rhapontici]
MALQVRMIMIIIVMRFQEGLWHRLRRHDIAHIASVFLSQLGCWLFFCLSSAAHLQFSCFFLRIYIEYFEQRRQFYPLSSTALQVQTVSKR